MTRVGAVLARYGLVVVIGWIGLLKFTSHEAQGIQPLVANSPFMAWLYDLFSVTGFATLLGVVEVGTAVLLAIKPWWPRLSAVGSAAAIGLFVATVSFLLHDARHWRGFCGRIPGAVDDRSVSDQRRCAAGSFRVEPG